MSQYSASSASVAKPGMSSTRSMGTSSSAPIVDEDRVGLAVLVVLSPVRCGHEPSRDDANTARGAADFANNPQIPAGPILP